MPALTMDDLLAEEIKPLQAGSFVEGVVLSIKKHEMWLDIGEYGVGLVVRRELTTSPDIVVGATIKASVINPETKEGHALLSLRQVAKDKSWETIQSAYENNDILTISPYDANRGGLLAEIEGVRGFLPVSQLAPDNYPRVSGSDKDEILQKLNKLIGKPFQVCVLDVSRKDNKLIFSEKEALKEGLAEQLAKMKVGDVVEGKVAGVIDFGAFVNINGIEGLIHISEISWERVEDPRHHIKEGEQIKVKIIAIDKERLALSIKQLTPNPWKQEAEGLESGSVVKGKITRITPFGAFVQISPSVEALVSVSDMADGKKAPSPSKLFKLGETREFVVTEINHEGRKISLSLK